MSSREKNSIQNGHKGKLGSQNSPNKNSKLNLNTEAPIDSTNGSSDSSKENGNNSPTKASNTSPPKGMTRRDQVMKMRESRIREEETNLTFKPTIQTRGRDTTTVTTNSNRFDKLYEEAKLRKEKTKKEEKLSFKPKITALGQSKQRSQTPEGTIEELYKSSGAGRKKIEVKEEVLNFQPRISKRGKSLDRNRDVSPSTRLYTQAQITQMKLTKKQEAKFQEEVKDCTFTPQTNSSRHKSTTSNPVEAIGDVTARMEKYQLLREKRIEELKRAKDAEDAQIATFKPVSYTVTHKSQRSSSRERGDVFTRLHETPKKVSESAEEDWEKEHTFRPTLVTQRAPSPLAGDENFGSVHEKLYVKGNQRRKELELEKEELRKELEKDLTFTPQVTHRESAGGDSKGPVFERLSASRQYVHEILTQIKTEFEMDECTFRPQINPVSESLSRHTRDEPVHVRLASDAERIRQENEKRRQKKLEEEAQECTFAPTLSTAFKGEGSLKVKEKDVFDRLSQQLPRPPNSNSQQSFSPPPPPTNSSSSSSSKSINHHKVSSSNNHNKTPPPQESQPVFIKRISKRDVNTQQEQTSPSQQNETSNNNNNNNNNNESQPLSYQNGESPVGGKNSLSPIARPVVEEFNL